MCNSQIAKAQSILSKSATATLLGIALLAGALWYIGSADTTHACSCVQPGSPTEELAESAAVFAGRVVSISHSFDPNAPPFAPGDRTTIEFEVSTVWKGSVNETMYVTTPPTGGSCGFAFEKGDEYIVYASHSSLDAAAYSTSICSRTAPLDQAQVDLDALGFGTPPRAGIGGPWPQRPITFARDEYDAQFSFNFTNNADGWNVGFADLPVDYEPSIYQLEYAHRPLPNSLSGSGIYVQGHNRSDDLFMYLKRQVSGLRPNTSYMVSATIDLVTNVSAGLIGIGGSPGESVFVKAGASTIEPIPVEGANQHLRMNIDKGNQSQGGESMVVVGNVAHDGGQGREFRIKTLDNRNQPLMVQTDSDGSAWLIVGTDSGFEGRTSIYYPRISFTLTTTKPPELPDTGGYEIPPWTATIIAATGALLVAAGLGVFAITKRPRRL